MQYMFHGELNYDVRVGAERFRACTLLPNLRLVASLDESARGQPSLSAPRSCALR